MDWKKVLFFGVVMGIIVVFFWWVGVDEVIVILKGVCIKYFVFVFFVYILGFLVWVMRWKVLIDVFNMDVLFLKV